MNIRNLFDETRMMFISPGIVGAPGVKGVPTGLDIDENLGIDLIEMEADTKFPLHTHPGAHIIFVLSGRGIVTMHGETHETRPGDCYFIPADIEHSVGAIEHHQLLSIGFPHKQLDDPERMHKV